MANRNPYLVLIVMAFGLFMALLDLTIVNIGIPQIVDALHATLDEVLWMLNAYSLVFAVLLITSGRLGDIFGPRRLFAVGIAVFTIASLFSGLAQTPVQLIVARAVQGLGAALFMPQALPINLRIFPLEKRPIVFAVYGMVSGLAVVLGPTVGGFLVTNFGWPSIFYVNLPIGIAVFACTLMLVPDLRSDARHHLDLRGVALATFGLLCVVFGLIEGQRFEWGTVVSFITIPGIIGAGVVLLVVFILDQAHRQDEEPLLPFGIFEDGNFTRMSLVLAAMGFAILGLFLPLTIYYQSVLHLSAVDAGLSIAPQSLAMFFLSPVVAMVIGRFGGKWILVLGLALFTAGMAYMAANANADGDRWSLVPGLLLGGVGLACVWTPLYDLATRDLKPRFAGVASGLLSTVQETGTVIASAAVGALLQNRLANDLPRQAAAYAEQLPAPFRTGFIEGFAQAAKGGLEIGAGQTGAHLQLPPGVPAQVVEQLRSLASAVFSHAFVDSMRVSLLLPIAVVGISALVAFTARDPGKATAAPSQEAAA